LITPTQVEIAWAAGLFEGEGCIYWQPKPSGRGQPSLQMRMTDEDVLLKFCKIVGRGKVETKPYFQDVRSTKTVWVWHVRDVEGVRHVLGLLMPHFGNRRRAKAREVLKLSKKMASYKVGVVK